MWFVCLLSSYGAFSKTQERLMYWTEQTQPHVHSASALTPRCGRQRFKQYLSPKTLGLILNKMLSHFLDYLTWDKVMRKTFFISASFSLPPSPQIFVLSGVIAMVTCAVFLRLNSLLKLAVLLLALAVYSYLIHLAFLTLTRHDAVHRSAPDTHTHTHTMMFFFYIQFNV